MHRFKALMLNEAWISTMALISIVISTIIIIEQDFVSLTGMVNGILVIASILLSTSLRNDKHRAFYSAFVAIAITGFVWSTTAIAVTPFWNGQVIPIILSSLLTAVAVAGIYYAWVTRRTPALSTN